MKRIIKTYTITSPDLFSDDAGVAWEKEVDEEFKAGFLSSDRKVEETSCPRCKDTSEMADIVRDIKGAIHKLQVLQDRMIPLIAPEKLRGRL